MELRLFALDGSRRMGEAVAAHLGTSLSPHEERDFEDGEHKSRPLVGVRGADVFALHGLYADPQRSVNDKLCRLLFFVGALRDAGAARVTVLAPYLCYARKERRTKARDPVTTRYVASMLEAVGADAVVAVDVHELAAFENAFRRCRPEHLLARPLLVRHLADGLRGARVSVVSPDVGGTKRARAFQEALQQALGEEVGFGIHEKQRSGGVVSGELFVGDVQGRVVVMVDDLVVTGTTLVRAARTCKQHGALEVIAAATHGLFVAEAPRVLADPALDRVVVTDSVPPLRVPAGRLRDRLEVVELGELLARAVRALHTGGSISALAGP